MGAFRNDVGTRTFRQTSLVIEGNHGLRNILSAERAEDKSLADDLQKCIIRPRRPVQGEN